MGREIQYSGDQIEVDEGAWDTWHVWGAGGEIWEKDTTWETYAYMRG